MGGIQFWHIVVLIVAFVLLFGWKNLPNAARSLGESMRVFKTEVDHMKDDSTARKDRGVVGGAPVDTPVAQGQVEDPYQDSAQEEYRRIQRHGSDGDTSAPRS
ncbi:Sec-independent protein translocase subunit TatA [Ornithinimicrobium pratense]|uniref:Sec-independent protein translocase protein TatA n=1 Tax=Ornithinimicrobium pratense TaxID=2593973 RepID=A0A5J6V4F9_9MICO|nr:Sec-independent protein translocase subunit TatA [Ornithinimicrobium pratense]QFG68655.1 Sec-independent protein translocase subunit TatA [Ornithinimicrobium pratense]